MNARLESILESHPSLGWLVAAVNWLLAACAWFVQHLDDITKFVVFGGSVFGLVAGYYTLRIQRRTWRRGQKRL